MPDAIADRQAWLKANPNDPRAAAVKAKLDQLQAAGQPADLRLPARLSAWAKPIDAAAAQTMPSGMDKGQWASLIAAVVDRESNGKNIETHADGHGHGLMGIDDRYHDFATTDDVKDPVKNIAYGAAFLKKLYNQTDSTLPVDKRMQYAADAYNAGPKALKSEAPDAGTTGGDYGTDVVSRAANYAPLAQKKAGADVQTPVTSSSISPAFVRDHTAAAPGATPPMGRSVSTISPPVPPRAPPSFGEWRSPEELTEDDRHSAPAVVAHYGAKLLPTAGGTLGGSAASILGLPAGPGALATGAAGAAGGTAAGRYGQIGIDRMLDYPTVDPASLDTAKQVLKEAAISGALQAIPGATGMGAGALAPRMAEGKIRDAAIAVARGTGAMTPARAAVLKGTQLETLSPDVLDRLVQQSSGGKGAVPAAGALSDDLRAQARASTEAAPLMRGQPLDQVDPKALEELLRVAQGGGENTPAAAKALADDFRSRAQLAREARRTAALAPSKPPDMDAAFGAEAQAARIGRQLPAAEKGADAMTNLPEITQAARSANLPPKNQEVIDAIRAKLSGGVNMPPHVQQMVATLSPADKAAALKQLGINVPDDAAVQSVFDNLRGSVSVAGDPAIQAKATGLLDAASTARSSTDQLQAARDAIAQAQAMKGRNFTPAKADEMGVQRLQLVDQAQAARAARDRVAAAADASSTSQAFGVDHDPLWYESQAGMLDSAAAAGTKAQGAQAKLDALGVKPGDSAVQAGADARSLDAFVNANTSRGLKRDTGEALMSGAALMGNRVRHALAESSPWTAGAPVPKAVDAARALEAEALSRGMDAVNPELRAAMQTPNNPVKTRAAIQALSSYLYGPSPDQPGAPVQ